MHRVLSQLRAQFQAQHTVSQRRIAGAFTIVELLVVITVIGILVGVVLLSYGAWRHSVASSQVQSDLTQVATAMESARTFSTGYPTSLPAPSNGSVTIGTNTVSLSPGVSLSLYTGSTGISYCIDGAISTDSSVKYHVDSLPGDTGAIAGTCVARTNVPVPDSPTHLVASSTADTQATLSWDSMTYAAHYNVQCSTDSGFTTGLVTASPSSPTATITPLTQLTTYHCRVSATDAAGTSGWSSTLNITTAYTPLTAPSGLVVTTTSTSTMSVTWNSVPGAASYVLQKASDAGFTNIITTTTPSGTSQNITGISANSIRYYRVQAIDNNGNAGNWSNYATGTTQTLTVLIVAGGGGGGGNCPTCGGAGGGGAGGLLYSTGVVFVPTVGPNTVTVGSGGAGGAKANDSTGNGANGTNSSVNSPLGSLTAIGGGGGRPQNGTAGGVGGSGGGGSAGSSPAAGGGGAGTSGQGYAGGTGNSASPFYGGSGGGAGGAGANGNAGGGGPGLVYTISGASVTYASGGGTGAYSGYQGAAAVPGGGGAGGSSSSGVPNGGAGTPNTGGGGGGAAGATTGGIGGSGGSGIVIISYPTGSLTATGGTITTSPDGTMKIHTFTSSGTFTIVSIP